jgi:hypothetical protein
MTAKIDERRLLGANAAKQSIQRCQHLPLVGIQDQWLNDISKVTKCAVKISQILVRRQDALRTGTIGAVSNQQCPGTPTHGLGNCARQGGQ